MAEEKKKKKPRLLPELPPMAGAPCMEFSANREVVIEGSRGVLTYAPDCVRINCAGMVLSFTGRELNLRCISPSALILEGFITNVEFIV